MAKTSPKRTPLTVENFPEVFDRLTAKFYNGSDTATEKPIRQGLSYLSESGYQIGKKIDALDKRLNKTEAETKENSELLEDEKAKKAAAKSILNYVKSLSLWQKILIASIAIHYLYGNIKNIDWEKFWDGVSKASSYLP